MLCMNTGIEKYIRSLMPMLPFLETMPLNGWNANQSPIQPEIADDTTKPITPASKTMTGHIVHKIVNTRLVKT